jgi:hypothetical protein
MWSPPADILRAEQPVKVMRQSLAKSTQIRRDHPESDPAAKIHETFKPSLRA